jgi:hypothetical protein
MTKRKKLKERFVSQPKDFTYSELKSLLGRLGYEEIKLGRTSGSRISFCHSSSKHVIRLHRPHPGNILKKYQES